MPAQDTQSVTHMDRAFSSLARICNTDSVFINIWSQLNILNKFYILQEEWIKSKKKDVGILELQTNITTCDLLDHFSFISQLDAVYLKNVKHIFEMCGSS